MSKTANGNVCDYDGGRFQLRVTYTSSNGGIRFCPFVVVSGGGFKKDHSAHFSWNARLSKTLVQGSITDSNHAYLDDVEISKTGAQWANTGLKDEVKVSPKKDRIVRQSGTYYACRESKKAYKSTTVTQKYVNKKNQTKTRKVTENVDTKGKYYNNYDAKVTISCKIGSKTSKVTIDVTGKPGQPKNIEVVRISDVRVLIKIGSVEAFRTKPVRTLTLYRREESISESGGNWTEVYHNTYGQSDEGGDINGLTNIRMEDHIATGKRYQWKITASNSAGSASTTTVWFWGEPPAPTEVTHRRLPYNDTRNEIFFTRSIDAVDKKVFRGFDIECCTNRETDPKQTWTKLSPYKKNSAGAITGDYEIYSADPKDTRMIDILDKHVSRIRLVHFTCKPDKSYRYRIIAWNCFTDKESLPKYSNEYGPSREGTEITYNTPSAPESVTGVFNDATGFVDLKIKRPEIDTTANRMHIERYDGSEWTKVPSSASDEGIPITPDRIYGNDNRESLYTDEEAPTGVEIKYRVAFGCSNTVDSSVYGEGNGRSKYKESNTIITSAKPNPPTPTMPINNSYALIDNRVARLAWIHSPKDGTPQEGAIIEYSLSDGVVHQITVADVSYYDLDISAIAPGETFTWKVKTKGKHPDYSDWSENYTFKVYLNPTITWTSPQNESKIANLPLVLGWEYSDTAGTLESLLLHIKQDDEILAEYVMPTNANSYNLKEYLFEDNEHYSLVLTARSSLGLSCAATLSITMQYVSMTLTNGFQADAEFDPETGYTWVNISRLHPEDASAIDGATSAESSEFDEYDTSITGDETSSDSPVERLYLYRAYGNHRTLVEQIIVSEAGENDAYQVFDPYAPVNIDFDYQLLQITQAGEICILSSTYRFRSLWWYIYWGNDEIVKARWNPTGSANFKRPEKQQIRYSGREYPVTYDSTANEETYSFSATLYRDIDDGREVLEQFKEMIRSGGSGVWKSFEGDVYAADFDFSYSANYSDGIPAWECSLNVTRTDTEEEL